MSERTRLFYFNEAYQIFDPRQRNKPEILSESGRWVANQFSLTSWMISQRQQFDPSYDLNFLTYAIPLQLGKLIQPSFGQLISQSNIDPVTRSLLLTDLSILISNNTDRCDKLEILYRLGPSRRTFLDHLSSSCAAVIERSNDFNLRTNLDNTLSKITHDH